jgi:hypothetical protein
MIKTPFTSGPWTYDPFIDTFSIGMIAVGPDPDNYPVAHVESWNGDGPDCEEAKRALANARLISSAPRIFHALQNLVASFDGGGAFGGKEWGYNQKFAIEARAALAEALGESA